MPRRVVVLGGIAAVLLLAAGIAFHYRAQLVNSLPPGPRTFMFGLRYGFRVERNVMVPMPDGVHLATDLYFPRKGTPPFPTVLVRLPYNKADFGEATATVNAFVTHGYAVALQDVRGKFASEGEFTASKGEGEDGSATLDWIAAQPWSNGKIGTFGCSALGESQIFLASKRNPHHTAMIPAGAGGAMGSALGRYTYFGQYEGGIFQLASGFGWFLYDGGKKPGLPEPGPVDVAKAIWELPSGSLVRRYRKDPTDYDDFISRPLTDPYFRDLGYIADEDHFNTPALVINTWQDQTVAEALYLSDLMKRNADSESARVNHHVWIGPGNHCPYFAPGEQVRVGELTLGPNAYVDTWAMYTEWFDYWLKGTGKLPDWPAYHLYVMGEDRWIDSDRWPPAGVDFQKWYLGAERPANSSAGGGTLTPASPVSATPEDRFTYDPLKPVRTRGGPICCTGNPDEAQGPADQRELEKREDVLIYTSPPLEKGLRIVGPLKAQLQVKSSALDTDFTAKLVDVYPDGRAYNIQEGALRMRYRNGYVNPEKMTPGEIYTAPIDIRAIAYYLPPGHRLRLQISSSNFPRLERNLNTGGNNYDESQPVVAHNTVLHTQENPSYVILPVLEQVN